MKSTLIAGFLILAGAACLYTPAAVGQGANVLVPQKGVGAAYGARDPRTCSSKTAPKSGPISLAMARQYFLCGVEQVNGNGFLFLTENLKMQVGRGVVPHGVYAVPRSDQDPTAKVYAIRGSFDQYICRKLDNNTGRNCEEQLITNATGDCYQTTFGDWKCQMVGGGPWKNNVAPPQN